MLWLGLQLPWRRFALSKCFFFSCFWTAYWVLLSTSCTVLFVKVASPVKCIHTLYWWGHVHKEDSTAEAGCYDMSACMWLIGRPEGVVSSESQSASHHAERDSSIGTDSLHPVIRSRSVAGVAGSCQVNYWSRKISSGTWLDVRDILIQLGHCCRGCVLSFMTTEEVMRRLQSVCLCLCVCICVWVCMNWITQKVGRLIGV